MTIRNIPTSELLFGVPRPPSWWAEHLEHRKVFEEVRESIKTEGLKKPLEVTKTDRGLVVEVGNQRLQALLDLDINFAPCIVKGD